MYEQAKTYVALRSFCQTMLQQKSVSLVIFDEYQYTDARVHGCIVTP